MKNILIIIIGFLVGLCLNKLYHHYSDKIKITKEHPKFNYDSAAIHVYDSILCCGGGYNITFDSPFVDTSMIIYKGTDTFIEGKYEDTLILRHNGKKNDTIFVHESKPKIIHDTPCKIIMPDQPIEKHSNIYDEVDTSIETIPTSYHDTGGTWILKRIQELDDSIKLVEEQNKLLKKLSYSFDTVKWKPYYYKPKNKK